MSLRIFWVSVNGVCLQFAFCVLFCQVLLRVLAAGCGLCALSGLRSVGLPAPGAGTFLNVVLGRLLPECLFAWGLSLEGFASWSPSHSQPGLGGLTCFSAMA